MKADRNSITWIDKYRKQDFEVDEEQQGEDEGYTTNENVHQQEEMMPAACCLLGYSRFWSKNGMPLVITFESGSMKLDTVCIYLGECH